MRIFAIETSCDETSAAIIEDGKKVCSLVTTTQIAIHQEFGGVVPEVASRYHVEYITAVLGQALRDAKMTFEDIDAIAVTHTPGLVGSLLVGIQAAKTLAFIYDLPLIPVHHIAGHIYANALTHDFIFPSIALVVSGGHTELIYMKDHFSFECIGATLDDAAGEVYDKVARVLGYQYPGGPHIDHAASVAVKATIGFPKPKLDSPYDFSFSGLKSSVLNYMNSALQKNVPVDKNDVAASFQKVVIEELVNKTIRAAQAYKVKQVIVCGGVSANRGLRSQMERAIDQLSEVTLALPDLVYCGDNAAMIGAAAYYQYKNDNPLATMGLDAKPNGKLSLKFKEESLMKTEKLSRATARRLPQYYRQFLKLKEKGITTINSAELEKIIKIEATTIRRDFSYIGELGKQRVGYNVDKVISELRRFLGMDHDRGVILFGVGHLGTALVNYNYIKGNNVRIVACFDSDADRTGTTVGDVPVYNITELEDRIPEGVNTAILALPSEVAQEVADRLVGLGFRGILNFSSHRLDVPPTVVVENIDLTSHLHTLMYLVNQEVERDTK